MGDNTGITQQEPPRNQDTAATNAHGSHFHLRFRAEVGTNRGDMAQSRPPRSMGDIYIEMAGEWGGGADRGGTPSEAMIILCTEQTRQFFKSMGTLFKIQIPLGSRLFRTLIEETPKSGSQNFEKTFLTTFRPSIGSHTGSEG